MSRENQLALKVTKQPTGYGANPTAFATSFAKGLLCLAGGYVVGRIAPSLLSSTVSNLASSALLGYVLSDTLSSAKKEDSIAGVTVVTVAYACSCNFTGLVCNLSMLGALYFAKFYAREGSYLHTVFHASQIAKQIQDLKQENATLNDLLTTPEETVRTENLTLQDLLEKERTKFDQTNESAASQGEIINLLCTDKQTLEQQVGAQKTRIALLEQELDSERKKSFFTRIFG